MQNGMRIKRYWLYDTKGEREKERKPINTKTLQNNNNKRKRGGNRAVLSTYIQTYK